MEDFRRNIQEKQAERKLHILKSFTETENSFEKGHMDFDSSNTPKGKSNLTKKTITDKNGHQTTKWVKQGEDVKDEKKPKEETTDSKSEAKSPEDHAKETSTEDLKKYLDTQSRNKDQDDNTKSAIAAAEKELKSRGDDTENYSWDDDKALKKVFDKYLKDGGGTTVDAINAWSEDTNESYEDIADKLVDLKLVKKEDAFPDESEKISHEQHMLLSEAMGDGSEYKDADEFLEQVKDGEVTMQSDDFKDLSDETIKNWFDENLAAKQENDLHNKLSKVDKSVQDLKKHLTPKKE
jgi:hypothetical protein